MLAQAVRAQLDPGGQQVVEVTIRDGYRPGVIRARAGMPLRIVFRREDDDACTERVVFSSPHIDRRLAPTGATTVELPAQPPGEVRFTCGMGRYRGRIELVDEGRRSTLAGLREQAARLEAPLSTAIVLWIFSLPFIGVIAMLAFDAPAALAAAGAALTTCVAGCMWASRGSARST